MKWKCHRYAPSVCQISEGVPPNPSDSIVAHKRKILFHTFVSCDFTFVSCDFITRSLKTLVFGGFQEWVMSSVTEFAFEVVKIHGPEHDAAQTLPLGIGYLGEHREVSKLMMKKKSNLGGHWLKGECTGSWRLQTTWSVISVSNLICWKMYLNPKTDFVVIANPLVPLDGVGSFRWWVVVYFEAPRLHLLTDLRVRNCKNYGSAVREYAPIIVK